MDFLSLSIADLYAMKAEAKEKESYYRNLKVADPKYAAEQKIFADLLYHADKELVRRLTNTN